MGWIAGALALGGAYMSSRSNERAANTAAQAARPWSASLPGLGAVDFSQGNINIGGSENQNALWHQMNPLMTGALGSFGQLNQNVMGQGLQNVHGAAGQADFSQGQNLSRLFNSANLPSSPFFGSNGNAFAQQASMAQGLGTQALGQAQGGYGGQSFLNAGQNLLNGPQNLTGNMRTNFDPGAAASDYTNLLRQQAQPQEQQAVASAMTGLFNKGRLGTTGGANQMGALAQAQQQADISRQVAGQQHGLQQQLMQQQGYDQALNAEQGRQLNQMGMAGQLSGIGAGLFGQAYNNAGLGMGLGQSADAFGFDRMMGLNNTQFDRASQLYTASDTATQDRFNRAMQMFGLDNSAAQQQLSNFQGLFGAQNTQMQGQLDLARLGASVGQSQGGAGVAAAQMRNQGNQDLIAGFMGAANTYLQNRNTGKVAGNG